MSIAYINSPLGIIKIIGTEKGIEEISFSNKEKTIDNEIPLPLEIVAKELNEYFLNKRTTFSFLLSPKGTEFQKKVWLELQKIPFGKTISYLELSKKIGDVKAIRAVASANGKNPIAIIIPCHRVIGTDGSLTGYAGKLWRKKWLLEHENQAQQKFSF